MVQKTHIHDEHYYPECIVHPNLTCRKQFNSKCSENHHPISCTTTVYKWANFGVGYGATFAKTGRLKLSSKDNNRIGASIQVRANIKRILYGLPNVSKPDNTHRNFEALLQPLKLQVNQYT